MSFVHLHNHSEYSMLDGLAKVKKMAKHAVEQNMPAIAITDHGVMHGVIEFNDACADAGVKPIIGMEAYLTKRGRHMSDRDNNFDRSPHHLLLLAMNQTGYKNLMRLATLSQLEGFYYKPRIDHDALRDNAEGIICTSGCPSAEIPRLILEGKEDVARDVTKWYLDTFKDRFYFEIQEHELPEFRQVNERVIAWAKEFGVPVIATNDAHYVKRADAISHDLMLCIQTTSLFKDTKRMKFNDDSYYLRSEAEMRALFDPICPEAITNTVELADRCDVKLKDKAFHLPHFQRPARFANDSDYMRYLCEIGFEVRYGVPARADGTWVHEEMPPLPEDGFINVSRPATGVYWGEDKPVKLTALSPLALPAADTHPAMTPRKLRERLRFEIDTINQMGFATYMLIVWDLIRFCREGNIWWDVRGSAAGSMVSHVLMLTNVEPVSNDLYFERFLNPERVTMPDIDMDFPDDQRYKLVDYTIDKYGADKVAQIITFGTMAARASLKDIGRVLDLPLGEVSRMTQLVPAIPGKPITLKEALEQVPDLKRIYDTEPHLKELYDKAMLVEGTVRNAGTHAAGVVIADRPLIEYAPLHRLTGTPITERLNAVTQFEMNHLESIGLLKLDYLGLSMLTIIRKACELIEERHGIKYTLDNIPIHEKATYDTLSRGDVMGVFQVEGCLSGDSYIDFRTIKELFEEFNSADPMDRFDRLGRYRFRTLSCYLDKGAFEHNRIVKVVASGVKPVYRLTDANGHWIKATADHQFLTQRGWVRLGEIDLAQDHILWKMDANRVGHSCVRCGRPFETMHKGAKKCGGCSAQTSANSSRSEVHERISLSTMDAVPGTLGLMAETAQHTASIQNPETYNDTQKGASTDPRVDVDRAQKLKARMSEQYSGKGNPMWGFPSKKLTKTDTKAGYREDIGHHVRSACEADVARVFRFLGLDYVYEPKTFELIRASGTTLAYTPDFYVPSEGKYYEVKDWLDPDCAEKLELFHEQYPDEELVLVDQTRFAEWQLEFSDLVHWECPTTPENSCWVSIQTIEYVGEEDTYDIQMEAPGNNFVANGFVVHNSGMRNLMVDMKPTRFENIVAAISLFRPGPMEYIPTYIKRLHGEEPVKYHHPDLEPIFGETYGICVSGDAILFNPITGKRHRMDEAGDVEELHLQGVTEGDLSPAVGRVTNWVHNGRKPVFQLRLANGAQIKVTAQHKLLTESGWSRLCDLKPGDHVAMPKKLMSASHSFDRVRLQGLAYLLADSDTDNNDNPGAVNFISKDQILIAEYERCVKSYVESVGSIGTVAIRQSRDVTRISAASGISQTYPELNSLLAWLRELGLTCAGSDCISGEKFAPDVVFGLNEKDIGFFLASLWDCAGFVSRDVCHYKTISERFAHDVQTLLLHLGIHSVIDTRICMTASGKARTLHQVAIYDTQRFATLVQPMMVRDHRPPAAWGRPPAAWGRPPAAWGDAVDSPTVARDVFVGELDTAAPMPRRGLVADYGIDGQHFTAKGLVYSRIGVAAAEGVANALNLSATPRSTNVLWEAIESIEPAGEEDVYDLTVEGFHNFVANNIIVHNCVYQEQIMRVARDFAGYSMGEADTIRKAVSKKVKEQLDKHKSKFRAGAEAKGYPGEVADQIWADIEFFARYGFNKSHAAIYASITCQTAWLKATYPLEYFCALLTVESGNTDKITGLIGDAKQHGIKILPPSVNASTEDFSIQTPAPPRSRNAERPQKEAESRKGDEEKSLRFGLMAIKNVGTGPVGAIIEARAKGGVFKSLDDFARRVEMNTINKRALEALIKVGAFDAFGTRPQLLAVVDQMIGAATTARRAAERGQGMLFGGLEAGGGDDLIVLPKNAKDIPKKQLLQEEKELIGTYVSEHPLQAMLDALQDQVTHNSSSLGPVDNGQKVRMAGVISFIRPHTTKTGKAMAFGEMEDMFGRIELTIFPRTWNEYQDILIKDQAILISGKAEVPDGGAAKILVERVSTSFEHARSADGDRTREYYRASASDEGSWGNSEEDSISAYFSSLDDAPLGLIGRQASDAKPDLTIVDETSFVDDGEGTPLPAEGSIEADPAFSKLSVSAGVGDLESLDDASFNDDGNDDGNDDVDTEDQTAVVAVQTNHVTEVDDAVAPSHSKVAQRAAMSISSVSSVPSYPAPSTNLHPSAQGLPPILTREPLNVVLHRNGDARSDVAKLEAALQTLRKYEGDQAFTVTLMNGGGKAMTLDFPNDTTRDCAELRAELTALLGAKCVQ